MKITALVGWVGAHWVMALLAGAAEPKAKAAAGWESLFDGKTLAGWSPSGFEAEGKVRVASPFLDGKSAIVIEKGTTLSGITSTRGAALPRMNYEITLEAMRVEGSDFFCGLTLPVGPASCTLVVGGWGGTVVGISSVDRADASMNETSQEIEFKDRQWYRIRVRVTADKIEVWLDGEKKIELTTTGRILSLRPGEIQRACTKPRGQKWRPTQRTPCICCLLNPPLPSQ